MIIKINKKNFPMNFSTYILHSNTFKFDYTGFDDDNNQMTDDFEFTLHFPIFCSSKTCTPNPIIIVLNNPSSNYIAAFKLVHNHINI